MNLKLFLSYLRKNKGAFALFAAFVALFAVTFYLYALPIESVIYAAGLCCVPGAVWLFVNYYRYRKKALLLHKLKGCITLDVTQLPEPEDAIEFGYIVLIQALFEEKCRLGNQADVRTSELLNYYTMWVHQVKVPLFALKLLLNADGKAQKEIENELFKIERYVEMVLGYLRMESMSSDLMIKHYALDDIVKQLIRKYSSLFISKKIRLQLNALNKEVLTDEKWLSFALEQVISNALKYTREGGTISIYMETSDTLIIEDTGIGIAQEDIYRVFERGYTGYNGRTDKGASGIGLYLCKQILQKLGHTISIQSQVHAGTKVKIGLETADLTVE